MDPVVLQYENVWLRRSDVSLLEGPHWLNDEIIRFAFHYFVNDCFQLLSLMTVFIGPMITEVIKFSTDTKELFMFLKPLALPVRQWIFLAVNNNSRNTPGGSHWSLLLYHRPSNKFIHYDSRRATNGIHARHVAMRLLPFLACKEGVMFEEHQCPQQSNNYDCGMYVIYMAELLCEQAMEEKEPLIPIQNITADSVTEKRAEWLKRIHALMERASSPAEEKSVQKCE
ncbi:sentrin-specific protease 8-like [Synchiropus picturatus]